MPLHNRILKRSFDLLLAAFGLLLTWPIILASWVIARKDTGASGFFIQDRIGQHGRMFRIVKLRTMRAIDGTSVTTANDPRITKWGATFRRYKIDELPQLWNVLKGDMSFVGPRPDVPGYMDRLQGGDRELLQLKPGITGPATLKYRDEEMILSKQANPQRYNDDIIWPDKVRINLDYLHNWSLSKDISFILQTLRRGS
jgi:lipopolysaccharide/colanic/teichoic acid biosynthesis glycosyltransferase